MDTETTHKIVVGVIQRAINKDVPGKKMEPNIDRSLLILVANKLEILMETFRIEDYTMPEVTQDRNDPTVLDVEFDYVPTRNFDWFEPIEWIKVQFKVSQTGANLKEKGS